MRTRHLFYTWLLLLLPHASETEGQRETGGGGVARKMEPKASVVSSTVAAMAAAVAVVAVMMGSSDAHEFHVGGRDGWVENPSESFDQWAGRNRFQVNDTLGTPPTLAGGVLLFLPSSLFFFSGAAADGGAVDQCSGTRRRTRCWW